jgi:hypothetical protein
MTSPLSTEQALHKIRFLVDDLEGLVASSYAWDASSYGVLQEIRDTVEASYVTVGLPSYGALQEIRDAGEATYASVGAPSDAEALSGSGSVIALIKALRTLEAQEREIFQDFSGVKPTSVGTGSYQPSYPTDLGGIFDIVRIFCEDATYIPAGTYMGAYVCVTYPTYPMMQMMEQDSPGTPWTQTTFLPTSGSFDFVLTHAVGTRWILPTLTNPSDGELTLFAYGVHRSA